MRSAAPIPTETAVVPGAYGASLPPRHRLPPAGAGTGWRGTAAALREACRDHHVPAGRLASTGAAEHCGPDLGGAGGICTWPAGNYAPTRWNALGPHGWRPLLEACRAAERMKCETHLAAELEAALEVILTGWPAALPVGHIHADLFPDNVVFPGWAAVGSDRFLFRGDGSAGATTSRCGCLNAWCFEAGLFNSMSLQGALIASSVW